MKKLLLVVLTVLFSITLSSCQKSIVEPDIINIIFENPRYEGTSFLVDVYITNGFDEAKYIGDMDLLFDTESGGENIAGAMFTMDVTIKSGEYYYTELEFYSSYVFITEAEFTDNNYDFKDIELTFWIYE